MMDPLQMDSIWLEDDTRGKLYNVSLPNMEVLNSDTPYLPSRSTVELPPLPPTSYFATTMKQEEERLKNKKSSSKLFHAFKSSFKSSSKETERKQILRTKISTPFDFSHISHVDKDSTITNRTFEIPHPQEETLIEAKKLASLSDPTQGVAFNRTEPANRHVSLSSTIPRSASLANSLASNTFSNARSSISTTATSTKQITRNNTHCHTASSSSIEQLTRLEKHQISKQCHPEYTRGSTSSVESTPALKDTLAWDTPSPGNAVRQSWIYDVESPIAQREKSKKFYTTENTMLRESLLMMNMQTTPLKEHIDKFTSTLNASFDEGPEFAEIQRGMKELSFLFGVNDSPTYDSEVQEAMASMRAANFTRLSRDLMRDMGEGGIKDFREKLKTVLNEVEANQEQEEEQEGEFTDVDASTISSEELKPSAF